MKFERTWIFLILVNARMEAATDIAGISIAGKKSTYAVFKPKAKPVAAIFM
jgi:hypothetical protein